MITLGAGEMMAGGQRWGQGFKGWPFKHTAELCECKTQSKNTFKQ